MGLTPAEIDALPEYTNAQLAKMLRKCLVDIGANPEAEFMVAGRSWSAHNLTTLQNTLEYFEIRARQDADTAATAAGGQGYSPVIAYQEPQS